MSVCLYRARDVCQGSRGGEELAVLPLIGLLALGVVVGAYGTLIGAGGGFVLVPTLLLLFPRSSPSDITAISLAVVFANALSGSISYWRLRRADYRSGLILAPATLPGAIAGALLVGAIPRGSFNVMMGLALLAIGGFLVARPHGRFALFNTGPLMLQRTLTDSSGVTYRYRYNWPLAMLFSVLVGFLSSILGIGGGIIHVPLLTTFFNFPEHVATATSHFVLMIMAGAATTTHAAAGDYAGYLAITLALAAGVLVGAPAGAALSHRIQGQTIIRLLAVALGVVGARLLWVSV